MSERTVDLRIVGMSCDGCVASVTRVLSRLPGTRVERVTVGSAQVTLDGTGTTDADLIAAVRKAGFEASVG
jgi:copper chaperone CopZ